MAPVTIAEVLDGRGEIVARTRILAARFRVGKGIENDVILSRGTADEVHAEVRVEEGRYLVEDLGSEAGTFRAGSGERIEGPVELAPGEAVTLGDVAVRFVPGAPVGSEGAVAEEAPASGEGEASADAEASRAAEPPVESAPSLRDRRVSWPVALGLVALVLAGTALLAWEGAYNGQAGLVVLLLFVGVLLAMGLWDGVWALGTKAARRRSYFRHHLAVTSLGGLVGLAVAQVAGYADTMWPGAVGRTWFDWVQPWLIGVGVLFAHLDLASVASRVKKAVIAGVIMVALMGLAGAATVVARAQNFEIHAALRPLRAVPPGLVRASDTEGFLERVGRLEERLGPP